MSQRIVELMQAPQQARNLPWLKGALQCALELELSTLPPYLCGQWALEDQGSDAAKLIGSVTQDEMSHLGLVCNLLGATGQQPQIFTGYDSIIYPGPLPGGVRPKCDPNFFPVDPNFQVVLGFEKYSDFVRMAMQIEYPEDPVPRPLLAGAAETFPSIGEFYDAVLQALQDNDGKFPYQTDKQLENDNPNVFVIDGLLKATTAVSTIQKQGEGSPRFPFADPERKELAHFYVFGELFYGKRYVFDDKTQTGDWSGDPVQIPGVRPMTPVPPGGYPMTPPAGVLACDTVFTQLLQQLDQAWGNGDPNALADAVGTMFALKKASIDLLQQQIPRPDGGIYGPQFKKRSA